MNRPEPDPRRRADHLHVAKAAIDMQFRTMSERARQLILKEADMLRRPGGP